MAARQRGGMTRTIILAHQVATMTGHLNSKAGLKRIEHYLKPVERSRKRRRRKDQSEAVAALLDRMAAKSKAKRKEGENDGK